MAHQHGEQGSMLLSAAALCFDPGFVDASIYRSRFYQSDLLLSGRTYLLFC